MKIHRDCQVFDSFNSAVGGTVLTKTALHTGDTVIIEGRQYTVCGIPILKHERKVGLEIEGKITGPFYLGYCEPQKLN